MKNYHNKRVIAYMPKEEQSYPAEEMGALRRGLWFYSNKLGLEFSLVLCLSFTFQVVIACYIGFKGMKTLPVLSDLAKSGSAGDIIATSAAVITSLFMQALLIAELAQVVWLRHPDKLKVRLQAGSVWWWLMLFALIITCILNFLLLFLSVTGKEELGAAWKAFQSSQLSGFVTLILCLLSLLTMLRCASVMKTSTSAEIRREVKEKLEAIATEMLLDAGEATRAQAMTVWANLNVNPAKFLPLQDTVLQLVSAQYPDLVPESLIGDTWSYDVPGNALARVPPQMHHALMQTRHRATANWSNRYGELWKFTPSQLAEIMAMNLEAYGAPQIIDATNPSQPQFLTHRRANLAHFAQSEAAETDQAPNTQQAGLVSTQKDNQSSTSATFAAKLNPAERVQFGLYLTHVIFPARNQNRPFPATSEVSIFECFDTVDLGWYYKEWRKSQ